MMSIPQLILTLPLFLYKNQQLGMRESITFQIFYWVIVLSIFSFSRGFSQSQTDSTFTGARERLSFDFHTCFFLKNNEYFGSFTKGFTGIGYFLQPKLRYDFGKGIYAHAGIHLLHYSGRDGYNQYIPLFRLSVPLSENIKLNAGHLEGTLAHGLSEPLFRYDIWYRDNIEYGIQFLAKYKKWKADLWLDWEIFIEPGDDFKEQFIVGLTSDLSLYSSDLFLISWPAELMIRHRGGQIDISSERVMNFLNASSGLKVNYQFQPKTKLTVEGRYYLHSSSGTMFPFKSGSAYYITSILGYKNIEAFLGYWKASGWMAFKGENLFQSVSDFNPTNVEKTRELLNAKLFYNKNLLPEIELKVGAETYYDLINNRMDYAMKLILIADIHGTIYQRK